MEVSQAIGSNTYIVSRSFRFVGKTLRDGQGQASDRSDAEVLDLVITNALVIDWSGIFKADIGVKNSKIVGIGKAGNPDTMDNVTEGMIVGSNTEVSGVGRVDLVRTAQTSAISRSLPERSSSSRQERLMRTCTTSALISGKRQVRS